MTAQIAHRAVALTAFGFLVVHILLETVAGQATPLAAVLPFVSASSRLYLGLGTIASDLMIAVIATSLARMRYSRSAHPQLWRVVHRCIYVAWPMAILHGILMRGVPVWAAWTYGICATVVALAITARIRMQGPLPQVPTDALGELTAALPPGVARLGSARLGSARLGYRRPVAASSQQLRPPAHRASAYRPAAQHQPGPSGRPAPGNRPAHPHPHPHPHQPAHPHPHQPAHPHPHQPAHPHQPGPREQPVPRARPAHRPRIVARRPAHYRPEHPEPPEYPGPHPARSARDPRSMRDPRSARDPRPAPRPVAGPAPPWPPARHPTDLY